tara:strand:- start:40 stop:294 length:255 start_codon:yes stop_codon:yes gene_type:complete
MAARLRNRHQDEIRKKIQVSQLINRLESYALGSLTDEQVTSGKLRAISILLNKTLPDLSATEVTQQVEGDVKVSVIELVAGVKS